MLEDELERRIAHRKQEAEAKKAQRSEADDSDGGEEESNKDTKEIEKQQSLVAQLRRNLELDASGGTFQDEHSVLMREIQELSVGAPAASQDLSFLDDLIEQEESLSLAMGAAFDLARSDISNCVSGASASDDVSRRIHTNNSGWAKGFLGAKPQKRVQVISDDKIGDRIIADVQASSKDLCLSSPPDKSGVEGKSPEDNQTKMASPLSSSSSTSASFVSSPPLLAGCASSVLDSHSPSAAKISGWSKGFLTRQTTKAQTDIGKVSIVPTRDPGNEKMVQPPLRPIPASKSELIETAFKGIVVEREATDSIAPMPSVSSIQLKKAKQSMFSRRLTEQRGSS